MQTFFNADMMILARRLRGFSQSELAAALNISQAKISKIEAGLVAPDASLIQKLADRLNFRSSFFRREAYLNPAPPNFHRKRQKLGTHEWERILARAELYRIFIEQMLRTIELVPAKRGAPTIDPDEFDGHVERIASAVRQAWLLPRGPIVDVTKAMEDAGIVIIPFDFGTELLDAFCQHAVDVMPSLIFINTRFKAKDRIRFSLAHELGHLVMHRMPTPKMEDEANVFAAAFLMPEEDIRSSFYNMSLEKFMTLKLYWKTSIQSLIRRARDVKRISDRSYRYYLVQLGKRGWRSSEPVTINGNIEIPSTLRKILSALRSDLGYGFDQLSEIVGVPNSETYLMFPDDKPRLRLVT